MFKTKSEAKEWICKIIEEYSYSFNKIFPNEEKNTGHFFKINFTSESFIIDSEYGRGQEKFNNHFQVTIPFKKLKKISIKRGNSPVKSAEIKFYSKWFQSFESERFSKPNKLNPRFSSVKEAEIVLHDEVLNDFDINIKLNKAFEILK